MLVVFGYITGFADGMKKYVIIVSLFTEIILIMNLIKCAKIASRLNGFTQKGVDEQEQWKAFKKYMEDFSMLDEREVPELVLWEKYLVYATVFGVADKVIKQLKIKFPELNDPNNLRNKDLVLFSLMSGPKGLNTNFISSINTSTAHMYTSTHSSGSGSGGGFSGGGGGRWTVAVGGGGR